MRKRMFAMLGVAGGMAVLVLAGGASAWSDSGSPAMAESRFATVDLFRALQAYMKRPDFEQARKDQNDQLVARESELRTRIQSNQQRLQLLAPNDPQLATTQAALQADSQAYREFQQTAQMMAQNLAIDQSTRAFLAVHKESVALAQSMGYSHLLATRLDVSELMTEDGPMATSTSQIIQELLARPVLMAPAGDDLTEQLMQRMDLLQYEQDVQAEGAEPAPGDEPAPGAGG